MHIQLTDILTCPVCGPTSGLIVRSDQIRDRRIVEGLLACPACERKYPVSGGVAQLDVTDAGPSGDTAAAGSGANADAALRIAALLGLEQAKGFVLIAGPAAELATEVAALAEDVEIVADAAHAPAGPTSRIRLGNHLPFYDSKLRGIWLSGTRAGPWLEEAARVLHPLGRLVLEPAPDRYKARLEDAGLGIAAEQDGTILASRA